MYKKKKVLALCLAGLCSTTTISNIYSASALAATSQSGAASETTAATTAGKSDSAASTAGGNPPSGETPPAKPDGDSSGNPQNGNGNPPSGENGKPGNSSDPTSNPHSDASANAGDGKNAQGNPPDGNGNPPFGENGKPGNPPDGNGNPPSGENGKPGNPPDGKPGDGNGPEGQPGGPDTQSYDYTGTLSGKLTADSEEVSSDGETITTSTADENAALAENGGTLKITNGTLEKSGDDTNGDNCNFYGINSILLSVGENSTTCISDSALSSDSEGSNGIFATNQGTVYSEKNSITTTKGNSRGLDATYGGTIIANDMTIQTAGDHSASLATDRGGGNISVTNSTLHTSGSGSPLLYSTGAIEVSGVTGTAEGSQIAGMEGLNHILIYDSDLSSTITDKTASDPVANGVIIYQSTSGDADTSTGESAQFQAVNSSLHSKIESGAMFYVTNTTANILLSNTTLDFDSAKAKLLQIEGNDANNWGHAGSNGAQVTFTGRNETLTGDISVDSISSLDLYLLDGTTYTGQIQSIANAGSQSANGGGTADQDTSGAAQSSGTAAASNDANTATAETTNAEDTAAPITVNIDANSTWVVTGDTTLFALNAEDGAKIVDESGKTVSIVADGSTVVKGDSNITITVTGTYSQNVSTSDANDLSDTTIDRSSFDQYYGTTTAFSTSGTSTKIEDSTEAAEETSDAAQLVPSEEEDTNTSTQQSAMPWIMVGAVVLLIFAGITAYKKKQG